MKTVGRMTVRELERVVEKVIEGKLYELIGDPDRGRVLRESVKRRLRRTLREEKRDSRQESLGHYCRNLDLQWSLDGGQTWAAFIPDHPIAMLEGGIVGGEIRIFREYLTERDWREIEGVLQGGYQPSLAAVLLGHAHQLADQGDLKFALIEGVSSLEIGLQEFLRQRLAGSESLPETASGFWNLPLPIQLIAIAGSLERPKLSDVEGAVEAIEMRNRVIHEGWTPRDDARPKLTALFRTIAALLPAPPFKFPLASAGGNRVLPPESWDVLP